MDLITILPLISAVVVFFLGITVLLKGKKDKLNINFALFSFVSTIWMFGTFMMFINQGDTEKIIFWDKFVYVGVVYIPVITLHFGLALTKFKIIKSNFLIILGYILSTFFLLLIPTDFFVEGVFNYKWGAHSKAQFFHHIFLVYFALYIILKFIIVFKYYRKQLNLVEKERIKYCFVAFFILATFGPVVYLPAYGIGIYPFAYLSGLIFAIIISYTIVRYRFLNIKFIFRSSSVYLLSLIVVFGLASGVKILAEKFFPEFSFWIDLMVIFFAVSTFPPIKKVFFRWANEYFFTSLYDSGKLILKTGNDLKTFLNIEEVYKYLYSVLSKNLHTRAFGVLTYNKENKKYALQYNQGFRVERGSEFDRNPLVEAKYIANNEVVITEELKNLHYNEKTKDLIDLLERLEVELLIPLKVKGNLIGLLSLGQKETEEAYNDEDLQVLEIISGQAAVAIENAQLYSRVKRFNVRLKKEVREAVSEVEKTNKDLSQANRKLSNAYKKLKQLDSAKNEFISIASHQLRTPLTSIKGFISMIMEGDYGKVDKEVEDALKKIFISNERLIKLVNDLLSLSRIESGKFSFTFKKGDIVKLVKDILGDFKLEAKTKKLQLKFVKAEKEIKPFVFDPGKIHEVISNLVDNALKYTEKGEIEVKMENLKEKVRIIVSDSGQGMSEQELEYVFEKFRRGIDSSSLNTEGTGLGLYVCRKIVDAHKGKIYAESDGPGKGSRFVVELKKKFEEKT
jgi:signal transduction histidine kinase